MVPLLGCMSRLDGYQKHEGGLSVDKIMLCWSQPEITWKTYDSPSKSR
jgi:hypothetical protein